VAHIGVAASASDTLPETITAAELDLVDPGEMSYSRIDGVNIPDAQKTPAVSSRPQLRVVNHDGPIRYIPIHIW